MSAIVQSALVLPFKRLTIRDVGLVGGKNASLGEMLQNLEQQGIRVPDGFATTATAYRQFIESNRLEGPIRLFIDEMRQGQASLEITGKSIRRLMLAADLPEDLKTEIRRAYGQLCEQYDAAEVDVAVRSSATAEDLPEASFAGQQETYLNIRGEAALIEACQKCYASLFTDRAIEYREERGFDHLSVALSVGVQKMVRSDKAGSGVLFTLDPETGFPHVVVINAAFGLGENVVKGVVNPDEYIVFKPLLENFRPIIEKKPGRKEKKLVYALKGGQTTRNLPTSQAERRSLVLSDNEILQLSRWGCQIESYYKKPMDIEWAKDGETGGLFIVQARPETVESRRQAQTFKRYALRQSGEKLLSGLSIGDAIAQGKVCRIQTPRESERFEAGAILVTEMTDPDWGPLMKKAAGIITDKGGRTCHAAIVSRELGIPAIVGTQKATRILRNGQEVTLDCASGEEGAIYRGLLEFDVSEINVQDLPKPPVAMMINLADPDAAFRWWKLPVQGVGLARMEFIIGNNIKIHPMALVHFESLKDRKAKREIQKMTEGYADKTEFFVEQLAQGIAKIASAQYPNPVIVRMSDLKTNEYANLIGGKAFEPVESNPMLGFRGSSRYYNARYKAGFALECRAIQRVRETMGFTNVIIMIPFCRTVAEADRVLAVLAENGLERGQNGLQAYVMAEVPSNIILAEEFAKRFDGFSIGSNDLTQLVLGIDRDSDLLAGLFDERNEAIQRAVGELLTKAHQAGRKVGICGQAPSDYPDFAKFLIQAGIDSISLNPASVIPTILSLAKMQRSG
jgi:pyruvate,water dikinase